MVMGELAQDTELLVIGSGPGGYAAAFRAADLGMDVTMVDTAPRPGGVCLHKGCIPSKTFLFLSELIFDAARAKDMGVSFGPPRIDLPGLRRWKAEVIDRMAAGLDGPGQDPRGAARARAGRVRVLGQRAAARRRGQPHPLPQGRSSPPARARSPSPGRRSPPAAGS